MRSFFKKFREGLQRTTPTFASAFGKVGGIFSGKKLDTDSIDNLEEALYGADFGVETATEIMEEIQAAYKSEKELRGQEAALIGASVLKRVLDGSEGVLDFGAHDPLVVELIGVNGSGKTTTTAKLGYLCKNDGYKPVIGACDTFRAAANEQIKEWSNRLKLDLVASHHGADAAAVAFDTYQAAKKRDGKVVLLDTAGRLHNKSNLMNELRKIDKVLKKHDETAPHHKWLVIDGSIGSNSIEQARVFHKEVGLTGLVITKLDGTSRGGALVGIYRELKLPIYFVGFGEKPEDLQPFSVENYVNAIFGLDTDGAGMEPAAIAEAEEAVEDQGYRKDAVEHEVRQEEAQKDVVPAAGAEAEESVADRPDLQEGIKAARSASREEPEHDEPEPRAEPETVDHKAADKLAAEAEADLKGTEDEVRPSGEPALPRESETPPKGPHEVAEAVDEDLAKTEADPVVSEEEHAGAVGTVEAAEADQRGDISGDVEEAEIDAATRACRFFAEDRISVWLGNFESQEALSAYMEVDFASDFGFALNTEDNPEGEIDEPESYDVESILDGFTGIGGNLERIAADAKAKGFEWAGTAIVYNNIAYDEKNANPNAQLTFIGSYPGDYAEDE